MVTFPAAASLDAVAYRTANRPTRRTRAEAPGFASDWTAAARLC